MTPEEKLASMGIELPQPPAAVAAYVPWARTGNLLLTSGQLPWRNGKMAYSGKLGAELGVEEGYEAARLCALNAIAQIQAAVGRLDNVVRVVRLDGSVQSAAGFQDQPQVLNGASDLFNEVFGDRGQHTRSALAVPEMPLDAAVQLSVTVEVAD